jgi:hypothetical protein
VLYDAELSKELSRVTCLSSLKSLLETAQGLPMPM